MGEINRDGLLNIIASSVAEQLIDVFVSRIEDRKKGLKPRDFNEICIYGRNVKVEDLFYLAGAMNERIEASSKQSTLEKRREATKALLNISVVIGYGPSNGCRGVYDVNFSDPVFNFFDEHGEPIQRTL